jgi:hypothetical protein
VFALGKVVGGRGADHKRYSATFRDWGHSVTGVCQDQTGQDLDMVLLDQFSRFFYGCSWVAAIVLNYELDFSAGHLMMNLIHIRLYRVLRGAAIIRCNAG